VQRDRCGFVPDDRLLAERHLLELHNIDFHLWEIRMRFGQECAIVPERVGLCMPDRLGDHVVQVHELPGSVRLSHHAFDAPDCLTTRWLSATMSASTSRNFSRVILQRAFPLKKVYDLPAIDIKIGGLASS
jgi:hypothetical protein